VGTVQRTDVLDWHLGARANGEAQAPVVREIMSPVIHAITPDRPVSEAAKRMVRERRNWLVVVDEAFRVVGLLSALDVLGVLDGGEPAPA
jgi:CBS domain-containing protein